jgi:cytochrome o ubiquinol oxidase subunit 2
MMAIDARGGGGLAGVNNVMPLVYDKYARRGSGSMRAYVAALCQRSGTPETDANVTDLARRISEPVHLASPQASAE